MKRARRVVSVDDLRGETRTSVAVLALQGCGLIGAAFAAGTAMHLLPAGAPDPEGFTGHIFGLPSIVVVPIYLAATSVLARHAFAEGDVSIRSWITATGVTAVWPAFCLWLAMLVADPHGPPTAGVSIALALALAAIQWVLWLGGALLRRQLG